MLQAHLVLLLLLQQVVLQGLHMLVHLLLQSVELLTGPVPTVPGLVCSVTLRLAATMAAALAACLGLS